MDKQEMKSIRDCWLSEQIQPYEMVALLNENPELKEYFIQEINEENRSK